MSGSCSRTLHARELLISEFVAVNRESAIDDAGESPDWIEIHNPGDSAVELSGWFLTDDAADLRKWRLPGRALGPGEFALVFASGEDRAPPGSPPHTNFKLDGDGEFLALVKADGSDAHEYAPAYPPQREDVSYGISRIGNEGPRYFPVPTPGAPNDASGVVGFVADTKFSRDRGFYGAPFDVALATGTTDATIRYTIDGSVPTEEHGVTYTGPIRISTTTTLRAAAFKPEHGPTNVDTHTYIFPAQVIRQDGAGFPVAWGNAAADYEMDPDVVDDPAYRDTIENDIVTTIPTLSIVMENDDLFGPRGLYSNTEERGPEWERPCSMEMIYPGDWIGGGDRESEQLDCGIRIFGWGSRPHFATLKHSLRLLFKRRYGPARLRFELFPGFDVEELDTVVLRAQNSRGWNDGSAAIREAQYLRDAWARYTARDMGKLTTSSTFVHLYLNGLYWGVYNPVERPDAAFMEAHLGGDEEDYDALNARVGNIEVLDGSREHWDRLIDLARADPTTLEEYQAIGELIDLPDLVDYMLINFYTVNRDWTGLNGNNMRVAGAPGASIAYRSFCWDMEYSIWNADDNVLRVATQHDSPATVHAHLGNHPEYRLLFADRAHKHLRSGGALTPEAAARRWMERAAEIDRAVVGESARWGDRRRERPYTRDVEWIAEQSRLLTDYFPRRADILLEQLEQVRLVADLEPPAFNQHGGRVEPGFVVDMSAPAGRIFVTTDGTDPRLAGGDIARAAMEFGGDRTLLVPARSAVRVLVPADGSLDLDWTAIDFDDGDWMRGETGVGYERTSGYEDLIATDVGEEMFQVSASVYLRIPFDVEDPRVTVLTLGMKYDDGFAAYLNGRLVVSSNAPEEPRWDSAAVASRSDSLAVRFEDFDLTADADLLRVGRNVLAIHGLNEKRTNGDLLILPQVEATRPLEVDDALVLTTTTRVRARAWRDGEWSALSEATFLTPGLRITEIMYHPQDPPAGSPFEAGDFEFLELVNIGDRAIDLHGARLSGGVRFSFDEGTIGDGTVTDPGPGDVLLIVKDIEAFETRHDTTGMNIAGEYTGNLSNGGEEIVLEGALGERILRFTYADSWHPTTDGDGHSLVVVDAAGDPGAWGEAASWRPSDVVGGTPGVHDHGPEFLRGDCNDDMRADVSDAACALNWLFAGAATPGCLAALDTNGDTQVNIADPVALLGYLFSGGLAPVEPFPACGPGALPTDEELGCADPCG